MSIGFDLVQWKGYDRLRKKLTALGDIPRERMKPLLETFEEIIVEDNRKGILQGEDKDGKPLKPVKYRPVEGKEITFPGHIGGARKTNARPYPLFGTASGAFKGRNTTRFGNLTEAQYERLDGPPTAPRYTKSRVITNLITTSAQLGPNVWEAVGAWNDVIDEDGIPFLPFLFLHRNLAGVRPWGREQARRAVRSWAKDLMKRL